MSFQGNMGGFTLFLCVAVPVLVFGKSVEQTRRSISCDPVSTTKLKVRLEGYGSVNKDIVAFDRHSARKNLRKAVLKNNFRPQIKETFSRKHWLMPKYGLERESDMKSDSSNSNCLGKGSTTANGNLNLCKKCTVSTTLPPDRFPRFITETVCSPADRLALGGQGACIERTIPMVFLKKSTRCASNADGTYTEEWEHYTHNVRVGCECEIRQNSYLRQLVFV